MTTIHTDNSVIHVFNTTTIYDKLLSTLQKEGHECGKVEGNKLIWCENDFCPKWYDNMDAEQKKEEEFAAKLEADGHTCVDLAESYPVQVFWCQQNPCKRSAP